MVRASGNPGAINHVVFAAPRSRGLMQSTKADLCFELSPRLTRI